MMDWNPFPESLYVRETIGLIIIIIIIITLFESQIILAEHECCTNWRDCKSNKSNQIKSNVGFCGEGKTGVPREKPLRAE